MEEIKTVPCVGCGFCCRKGPCELATQFNIWRPPENGGCRSLKWDGTKWRCTLVTLRPEYAEMLYAGEGCCCSLNTDRRHIPTPDDVRGVSCINPVTAVDWKKALRSFVRGMAGSFVSGDAVYLAILSMKRDLTPDEFNIVAEEIAHAYKQNTSKFSDGFIGTDIPRKI
jgi:hypothetical protein